MKHIAIILVSCLFVLTVQPVASNVYALTKHHSCCGKNCCSNKMAGNKCLPIGCNTCATCVTCFGFFVTGKTYKLQPQPAAKIFAVAVTKKLISNYYSNCFHPPQMV